MNRLTLADIQNYIDNKISESLNLDYKQELGDNTEISKDIAAFANAAGGKIIYGVVAKNGIPISKKWIISKGVKERIESVIISNIQTELKGFEIYSIENPDNIQEAIFVVDVPESIDAPHMANYRYYIRRNFQSEPMEDYEVKNLIFKKGLKKALSFEISQNLELARSTLDQIEKLYSYRSDKRKPMALIPFYTDAWKSIVSSGLLFVIKENASKLVEAYGLIHKINSLIGYLNSRPGVDVVVTPLYPEGSIEHGTWIPAILRSEIPKFMRILEGFKNL